MEILIVDFKFIQFLLIVIVVCNTNAQNYESYFGQNETHIIQINNNYTLGMFPNSLDSLAITTEVVSSNNMVLKEIEHYEYPNQASPSFIYYLREEISTGRLWIRSTIDGSEFLISDMTLDVGDSVNIFSPYFQHTVSEVNFINGKKHVFFDEPNLPIGYPGVSTEANVFFIEGIIPFMVAEPIIQQIQGVFFHGESAPVCIIKDGIQVFSIDDYWEVSISPNSYILNWVSCDLIDIYNLGNEDFSQLNFAIYPNPAQSFFKIESDSQLINQVEIIDINGKHIKTFKDYSNQFDVSDLSKGLYLVKISTEHSHSIKKLLKE